MTYPFYSSIAIYRSFLLLLEEAEQLIRTGGTPVFLTCDGSVSSCCFGNVSGNKTKCRLCRVMRKEGLAALSQRVACFTIGDLLTDTEIPRTRDVVFPYRSNTDILVNPTFLHYATIRDHAARVRHMFTEKPVFAAAVDGLAALHLRPDGIYYVACPLRHSPVLTALQAALANQPVYAVRAICSSYLPEWQPGTDYRADYGARGEMGGVVRLDLIHELDYLTHLLGFPRHIQCLCGKYSDLEIDSDDLAVYVADFGDKLAEVHLDYFGRVRQRQVEFFTRDDVIVGDFVARSVCRRVSGECQTFPERPDPYEREMSDFLDCVLDARKSFNEIEHANRVLQLAEGRIPCAY